MSTWSSYQQYRLGNEQYLLRTSGFEHFEFHNATSSSTCYLAGYIRTSCDKSYSIRIDIPNFPYECPSTYVTYPCPLNDFWGKSLVELGTSSTMHTLVPKDNYVQLCLYKRSIWDSSVTLLKLIIKAHLWLEAYEKHLVTARPIDEFVLEM